MLDSDVAMEIARPHWHGEINKPFPYPVPLGNGARTEVPLNAAKRCNWSICGNNIESQDFHFLLLVVTTVCRTRYSSSSYSFRLWKRISSWALILCHKEHLVLPGHVGLIFVCEHLNTFQIISSIPTVYPSYAASEWPCGPNNTNRKPPACCYSSNGSALPNVPGKTRTKQPNLQQASLCFRCLSWSAFCYFSAGRQQRRTHGGGGLCGVRLSPPTQWHHQPQSHRLHRCVTSARSRFFSFFFYCYLRTNKGVPYYSFYVRRIDQNIKIRFNHRCRECDKLDSAPDCRLHHIHSSALTSLANGVLIPPLRLPNIQRICALRYGLIMSPFLLVDAWHISVYSSIISVFRLCHFHIIYLYHIHISHWDSLLEAVMW